MSDKEKKQNKKGSDKEKKESKKIEIPFTVTATFIEVPEPETPECEEECCLCEAFEQRIKELEDEVRKQELLITTLKGEVNVEQRFIENLKDDKTALFRRLIWLEMRLGYFARKKYEDKFGHLVSE